MTVIANQTCTGASTAQTDILDDCLAVRLTVEATSLTEGGGDGYLSINQNNAGGCDVNVNRFAVTLRLYDRNTTELIGTFEDVYWLNISGIGFQWFSSVTAADIDFDVQMSGETVDDEPFSMSSYFSCTSCT